MNKKFIMTIIDDIRSRNVRNENPLMNTYSLKEECLLLYPKLIKRSYLTHMDEVVLVLDVGEICVSVARNDEYYYYASISNNEWDSLEVVRYKNTAVNFNTLEKAIKYSLKALKKLNKRTKTKEWNNENY